MTDLRILSLYWRANWRYPRLAVGLLVMLVFGVGVDFAVPLLVAAALNRLVEEGSAPLASFVMPLVAVVALQALGMLAWRVAIECLWRLEIAARRPGGARLRASGAPVRPVPPRQLRRRARGGLDEVPRGV